VKQEQTPNFPSLEDIMDNEYRRYLMYSNVKNPTDNPSEHKGFFTLSMSLAKKSLLNSIKCNMMLIKDKYCE
jgi:hypothetical protein